MIILVFIFILPSLSLACPLHVQTPLGIATGSIDISGTARFAAHYATAERWGESVVASKWKMPSSIINSTKLPLPCPQPGLDSSDYTEDCLSVVLYIPRNVKKHGTTLVWIHGGSFIVGSATGPGLDGSNLASATNSVVAIVQHRLGALGFLAPDGKTNLAVKDIINAMKFINVVAPSFGGSSTITLAGQSSGANMIRALLAAPSASWLFKSGILHSDPMNYGFLSSSTQQLLQSHYNSLINCTSWNTTCWKSLSLDTIVKAQMTLYAKASSIDPAAGVGEPMRPVKDGVLITSPLDSTAPFPSVSKALMISTVLDEAGPAIYEQFSSPLEESKFQPICNSILGPARTSKIMKSEFYKPNGSLDARDQLLSLATDMMWKCPSWTFVRNWVQHGGRAYVGLYTVGATYPTNTVSFCEQAGKVCHEDDIMIVFGTVPNPTSAQSSLIAEVQRRYKAFMYSGDPNEQGLPIWTAATGSDINAHDLVYYMTIKFMASNFYGTDAAVDSDSEARQDPAGTWRRIEFKRVSCI
ncbi:hypothetical protein APHAL10511_005746 [Amanita phalloides]|nr:hypothetical protein APHAL10511_005746 [Amanita phalloides]